MPADLPDELIEKMTAQGLSVDDFDALDDEFQDAILAAWEAEQAGYSSTDDDIPGAADDLPADFLAALAAHGVSESQFRAMDDVYREQAAAAWLAQDDDAANEEADDPTTITAFSAWLDANRIVATDPAELAKFFSYYKEGARVEAANCGGVIRGV